MSIQHVDNQLKKCTPDIYEIVRNKKRIKFEKAIKFSNDEN